jgi:transposase InsO family protein
VYPNLARQITLTGINQLWRADITYVRLAVEFVYLAVILDAYSRRVIGWELNSTLEDSLTLVALRMALSRRTVTPELVHHSDRGVQYASGDYTQLLQDHHIQISMSRKANPWDNAACESFMKTLKCEEVYRTEYRDQAEARLRIGEFIERVYNETRLHSALDYRPPAEFERELRAAQKKEAATRRLIACVFSGIGKSFHPMGAPTSRPTPPLIVWMSFRLAIPWPGALPQSRPPLHQPITILQAVHFAVQ